MDWRVRIAKRAMDVVGGMVGLAMTAPLYPVIAAAIRLESSGPIFYRQRRAGGHPTPEGNAAEDLKVFDMLKFRTMVPDAEKKTGVVVASTNDPRVTRVGKFLRRTRLDEIPQFINVLRGDMSIVGPRPERPELIRDLAMAIPMFEERTRMVRPGITGLAQVSLDYAGRMDSESELAAMKDALLNPFKLEGADDALADDMRTKLLYDVAYSAALEDFWTWLRTDVEIIVKTPYVMVAGKGR